MECVHTYLKSGYKLCNFLPYHTIKKFAHKSVSLATNPLRKTHMYRPRASLVRCVSSLEKESEIDPFSHVQQDLKKFNHDIRQTLDKYITNADMHNIATHMYTGQDDNKALWVSLPILVGKALNHHVRNDGNLTEPQSKIVMISDLLMATLALHDDVVDNSKTRRGVPSANVVWYPYKSIVVGNMIFAICMEEARKLDNPDLTISIGHMYESFCRGQYMQCQKKAEDKDRLAHYLEKTNFKSGGAIAYGLKAMAQAIGASDALTEAVMKYAQNVCNVGQLVDDLMDFRADLIEGVATAPVIFACREHPVLEKMMLRNFQHDGDVDKAIQLVDQSRGLEEAKHLAGRYCTDAMRYAKCLAVSPYQEMLEAIVHYYLYRLEYDMEKQEHDDRLY